MEGGIFLLLGSNLGDRLANLSEAARQMGTIKSSPVYVTAAWGKSDQPDFYNQAIEIETSLSPDDLLQKILEVEKAMGRERSEKWGPRVIDIDILFYNNEVIYKKNLVIPHPEIQNRRFALEPLAQITNLVHPVLRKTIEELLKDCKDPLAVTRLQPQR
jgi:2-amino-4-hydroxy-6-hydroxymethyldihydropteridine diphosphokinase